MIYMAVIRLKKPQRSCIEGGCRGCPYLWLFSRVCFFAIAFPFQDNDLRVVDEPVGDRSGHSGAVKDIPPLGKRQIGGDNRGFHFVSVADDLEE